MAERLGAGRRRTGVPVEHDAEAARSGESAQGRHRRGTCVITRAVAEALTPLARLRSAVVDTVVVTRMSTLRKLHELDTLASSIITSVIFILVFTFVFGRSVVVPGGDYTSYLLSGMLPQAVLFSAGAVAVTLAADMQEGVIDRFRTMPISRSSVLTGRTIATAIAGMPGLTVMTGCAFVIGLRPQRGVANTVAAFLLVLGFALAMCWVGVLIGLLASGPGAANALSMAPALMLSFVSNVYVDPAGMPGFLRVLAEWNPLSTVVAAVRRLLGASGGPAPAGVWPLQHPIVGSLVMIAAMFIVLVPCTVRLYSRVR